MTLADIRDWLRTFGVAENYYIGRLDNKKERSLGVYDLARRGAPVMAIGGLACSSYDVKSVSLLLHWSRNANETELAAQALWDAVIGGADTTQEASEEGGGVRIGNADTGRGWTGADDGEGNVTLSQAGGSSGAEGILYVRPLVPKPIAIDTDENGVYEYVIEIDIYYRR